MQSQTALQQLTWTCEKYGGGFVPYPSHALLSHRAIADISDCPAGWAVRIYIPYETPGAHEVFETYEEAKAAVERWVSGLDIDPGE